MIAEALDLVNERIEVQTKRQRTETCIVCLRAASDLLVQHARHPKRIKYALAAARLLRGRSRVLPLLRRAALKVIQPTLKCYLVAQPLQEGYFSSERSHRA